MGTASKGCHYMYMYSVSLKPSHGVGGDGGRVRHCQYEFTKGGGGGGKNFFGKKGGGGSDLKDYSGKMGGHNKYKGVWINY